MVGRIKFAVREQSVKRVLLYYTQYSISRERFVSHTSDEKKKLLVRINRIQGQLQSIRKAIEEDAACEIVLQQIAACRGAVNSLLVEIVEGEIRFHVLDSNARIDSKQAKAADNLVGILHRYIK